MGPDVIVVQSTPQSAAKLEQGNFNLGWEIPGYPSLCMKHRWLSHDLPAVCVCLQPLQHTLTIHKGNSNVSWRTTVLGGGPDGIIFWGWESKTVFRSVSKAWGGKLEIGMGNPRASRIIVLVYNWGMNGHMHMRGWPQLPIRNHVHETSSISNTWPKSFRLSPSVYLPRIKLISCEEGRA